MKEIKTVYFVKFFDDETGELFAAYPFRTWAGAKYFLDERIKNNSVESVNASPVYIQTPIHPEGELVYVRLGMEGVNSYNTCISIVSLD